MVRITRKRMHIKKGGSNVGQFFGELQNAFKGLFSRTRNRSAQLIDDSSRAISSAIKGAETTVSNVGENVEKKVSSIVNQGKTSPQMMGGKKYKTYKSRKYIKSKKMMASKKGKMYKSRKSRKSKIH